MGTACARAVVPDIFELDSRPKRPKTERKLKDFPPIIKCGEVNIEPFDHTRIGDVNGSHSG